MKKLNIRLICDSANSLLGMETTQISITKYMDELWYIHNEVILDNKKE